MKVLNLTDGYKVDHRSQYPKGTTLVYSNFTPRSSRMPGVEEVIFFGLQYFIKKYLIEEWGKFFAPTGFSTRKSVITEYQHRIESYLGKGAITYDHVEALQELGYLPLEIKALPEGTACPLRVPMFTIKNTHPDFFWLTNFLETIISCVMWMPCTSATTAFQYRKTLERYAKLTGGSREFVKWQGHDFSFRGMAGLEAAQLSGAAHLLSFTGTDTIPAIDFLEQYYGADALNELIGGSVPATEHSVMCMGGESSELETIRRLITEVYPRGIVSIVCDSWDFWRVITEYLPALKGEIMARDGKVVVRPDSGDPVKIICGDPEAAESTPEALGAVACLWREFGDFQVGSGSVTFPYRHLNSHIGLIYGDSITLERCNKICDRLAQNGYASTNVVFGIGSYTYQHVTRDTFGFAMKATYGEVNGEPRCIFKKPKTDSGEKHSAKGLLWVGESGGRIVLDDNVPKQAEQESMLKTVFKDGKLVRETTLAEIRARIEEQL